MRRTKDEARRDYERWIASRCRRAADDLEVAAGEVNELVCDARRERSLLDAAARRELEEIEAAIRALRTRVAALSPLPIDDEA